MPASQKSVALLRIRFLVNEGQILMDQISAVQLMDQGSAMRCYLAYEDGTLIHQDELVLMMAS